MYLLPAPLHNGRSSPYWDWYFASEGADGTVMLEVGRTLVHFSVVYPYTYPHSARSVPVNTPRALQESAFQ